MVVAAFVAPFLLAGHRPVRRHGGAAARRPARSHHHRARRAGAARAGPAPGRALAGGRRAGPAADRRGGARPGAAARAGAAAGRGPGAAAGAAGGGPARRSASPGMDVDTARNVRDKARMKTVLPRPASRAPATGWSPPRPRRWRSPRPSASRWSRSRRPGPARRPPTGSTTPTRCGAGSRAVRRGPRRPGCWRSSSSARSTRSTASRSAGQTVWASISDYLPPPLEVLRNPWIQWTVLLPRELDDPRYAAIRRRRTGRRRGARRARRVDAHGVVPAPGRLGRGVRGRGPAAGRADLVDAGLRARRRLLPDVVRAGDPRPVRPAGAEVRGRAASTCAGRAGAEVRAVHGVEELQRRLGHLVVEARLPEPGQPASSGYEGEGYVIVRHPETAVVRDAVGADRRRGSGSSWWRRQ